MRDSALQVYDARLAVEQGTPAAWYAGFIATTEVHLSDSPTGDESLYSHYSPMHAPAVVSPCAPPFRRFGALRNLYRLSAE